MSKDARKFMKLQKIKNGKEKYDQRKKQFSNF